MDEISIESMGVVHAGIVGRMLGVTSGALYEMDAAIAALENGTVVDLPGLKAAYGRLQAAYTKSREEAESIRARVING